MKDERKTKRQLIEELNALRDVTRDLEHARSIARFAERLCQVGTWEWDAASDRVQWSEGMYEMHGVTADEFDHTFDAYFALVHPEDRDEARTLMEKVVEGRTSQAIGYRLQHPDGRIVSVVADQEVVTNDDGIVTGVIGTVQNVTTRRLVEDALVESESKYRLLVESSLQGVAIFGEGKLMFVNRMLAKAVGFTPLELVSMPRRELLELIHPEDRESVQAAFSRKGIANLPTPARVDVRLVCRSGKIRWLTTLATSTLFGGKRALVVSTADVTDQKEAWASARHAEERYRSLFNEINDAIYFTTEGGHIIDMNPTGASLFGYSDQELREMNAAALYADPDQRKRFKNAIHETGALREYPVALKRKDGSVLDGLVTSIEWRDSHGEVAGYQGIIRDVTERVRMERELAASEERYRTFVELSPDAVVVHRGGEIVFANSAAAELLGADSPGALLGRDALQFIAPKDRPAVRERIKGILVEGRAAPPFEETFVRMDGSLVPVEVRGTQVALRDGPAVLVVARDITDRNRTRDLLMGTEALAHVGSWEWDLTTNRVVWSPEMYRQFGISPEELLEPTFEIAMSRIHPADHAAIEANTKRALETGTVEPIDYRITVSDGSIRYMRGEGTLVLSATGDPQRMIGLQQDRTRITKTESELEASEARYRTLFANAPIGIGLTRSDGSLVEFNDAVLEPGGWSRKDVRDTASVEDLYADRTDREEVLRMFRRDGFVRRHEVPFRRKHGEPYFASLSLSQVVLNGEELTLAIVEDIDDRKRAEEARRASEASLRAFLDALPAPAILLDRDLNAVVVNAAIAAIVGRPIGELLNAPVLDWIPTANNVGREFVLKTFETGEPQRFRDTRGERTYWVHCYPVRDETGAVVRVAWLGIDVTQQERAEAELRESEERYRRLAENAPAIVYRFRFEPDPGFDYISPAVKEITGYGPEGFYSDPGLGMRTIHPDDRPALEGFLQGTVYEGSHVRRWIHRDGRTLWIEDRSSPVYGDDGNLVAVEGIALDVTNRRKVEDALRLSDRVLESTPDHVAVVGSDYRYQRGNRAHCAAHGVSRQELPGKHISDLIGEDQFDALVKPRIDAAFSGEEVGYEDWITYKELGRQFMGVRYVPMHGDDGVDGVVIMSENLTGRRLAEEALERSESQYRSLFESARDGIFVTTPDGSRYLDVNPAGCDLLGYGREDLLGLGVADVTATAEASVVLERLRAMPERDSRITQRSLRRADGRMVEVEISSARLASGPVLKIVRDLTEREAAARALAGHARQQEAVARLGRHALEASELNTLMDEAVQVVSETLEVEFAKVLELLPNDDRLLLRAGVGWQAGLVGSAVVGTDESSQAGYTLRTDDPVVVENLRTETRFAGPSLLTDHGVVSGVSVVIAVQDRQYGVLGAHTAEPRQFGDDEVVFLTAVAAILGQALERATAQAARDQAERALKRSRERLRRLAVRLQEVREEERGLLAREMHDELGQALTSFKIDLDWLDEHVRALGREDLTDRCEAMEVLLSDTITAVRELTGRLRPPVLDDLGLAAAVDWQVKDLARRTRITWRTDIEQSPIRLTEGVQTAVFRIFQETATNIVRHAEAQHVDISLRLDWSELALDVRDDGVGISSDSLDNDQSVGLIGMRERAAEFGGSISIQRGAEGGTLVELRVPLATDPTGSDT